MKTKQRMLSTVCLSAVFFSGLAVAAEPANNNSPQPKKKFAIVIHGGAGGVPKTSAAKEARRVVLEKALTTGRDMLKTDATAMDTVVAVIRILEDAPEFNAGRGAVLNAAGKHELDASIMDGKTRNCGAVGGVRTIRHPISLARLVMSETRHVLLVADGAEEFANKLPSSQAVERVENSWFTTERQRKKLKAAQLNRKVDSLGTVGCVVLDQAGNLAAGTSTGGLSNKKFGRIGDTPIISAGTYADNRSCAVSCTGIGEDFIRYAVAFDVSAKMRYQKKSLDDAVHTALHDKEQVVRGGIIAIDRDGNISQQFNTSGMSRAAADSDGLWKIAF